MKKLNNYINFKRFGSLLFLLLVFLTTHINAQELTNLNMTSAIQRVLEENPNLAANEASLEATRSNIAIARGKYLPGVNVFGSVSQSKSATFSQTAGIIPSSSALVGASLSQMVYNEQYLANFKIQKYLFASEEEQLKNTRYNTITAAGQSYIGLLFALDLLNVQNENINITKQNLNASRDRLEVGSTNQQEVLRWETQMYSDRQSIESQKASVIISRGSLNQLLNLPLETPQNLEKLSIEENGFIFSSSIVAATINDEAKALIIRDFLVELGLVNSPVLASFDQQLLAQERQLKSTKRWAIPKFNASVGANAKFDLNKEETEDVGSDIGFWKYGMTMYWPIVDGGANINKMKQSRFQLSALELQKLDIQNSIEQSIRASAAVVVSDFINVTSAKLQADAAQKNYDLVYDSYYVGESSLLDLLDAQNQKLIADIQSRVALYTFFSDLLAVEHAIGYFPFLESLESLNEIVTELERRLLIVK